ncbi:MAG: hypothetical protein EPO40_19335 [Myxococcaceae bacterium]|nr:MAG: hypothetical protein EPO40_19335 [Myxococcaceae bacterium]
MGALTLPHTVALPLALLAASGACDRAPSEPRGVRSPATATRAAEPSLEAAARSLGRAVDAGVGPVHPLGVPTPAGTIAVGFTLGGIPSAALVEAERASVGRDGAERALALWAERAEVPDATRLARTVGALVYPGCAVDVGGELHGPTPSLGAHPGGGRVLTFSFVIPEGRAGAGLHVARWRWTDSGLLIEASPHPERR